MRFSINQIQFDEVINNLQDMGLVKVEQGKVKITVLGLKQIREFSLSNPEMSFLIFLSSILVNDKNEETQAK